MALSSAQKLSGLLMRDGGEGGEVQGLLIGIQADISTRTNSRRWGRHSRGEALWSPLNFGRSLSTTDFSDLALYI